MKRIGGYLMIKEISIPKTGGEPIGIEVRAQAFSFATNDEINDMTFYNYELINRGTFTLYETYFGQYVDADIGDPTND